MGSSYTEVNKVRYLVYESFMCQFQLVSELDECIARTIRDGVRIYIIFKFQNFIKNETYRNLKDRQ